MKRQKKVRSYSRKNPDGNPIPFDTQVKLQTFTIIPLNQLLIRLKFTDTLITRLNNTAKCAAKVTPIVCLYTIQQIYKLCDLAGFTTTFKNIIMDQLKHYEHAEILVRL